MDMTTVTASIEALATDVGTAGAAVLTVVLAFAAFKWIRRAVS
jgi:uncharacterized membrane protein